MNLATEAAESTRRMAMQLWPVALDDLGLVAALQWHIERFAKREGLKVDMKVSGVTRDIAPEIELAIYRIVQECLRNVARHARASTASVFLECVHDKLRVEIKDDGCGFDPLAVRRSEAGGMGMLGMSERAALVGGTVTFSSRPGSGTTVRVEVPLRTKTTPAMMAEDMAT
jgi:signal transduction histidine kinase